MHGEADAILNSETRDEFPKKQEEDNMDFSEKLKQIRKSEGKPFGYSDNSYWLYFTNRGGEIDI